MKKFIFILMIIVSNFFSQLNAEIINDIVINNNDRISLGTIKTYGNIELGKSYSEDDLNNILKNLYNTKFFKDVSLKIENQILIIDLIENKLVQTIIIEGIKSSRIQEAILEGLTFKEKSPFIDSEISNDLVNIKSALTLQGYYFSNVLSNIKVNDNNTVDIIFNIDLGEKSKISIIEFTGDKIFKNKTLLNLITSEENKFWKFISGKKYLNQQSILLDERLLRQFYLNNGYYDVNINTSTATILENKSFKLTYNINAGNLFKVNKASLDIPVDYDPLNFIKIKKLLNELEGNEYSFSKISKIVKEIDKVSLSREYDFINATIIEEKLNANKININFKVSDSEKLYIERINILGNNITEESVIRSNLEIDEGDPFNELLHTKSLNNLKSLNIFKTVKSEIVDGLSPATKIINIDVEEKPTGEISLGAGFGTDGGTVGFSVSENNFLGKGVRLSTSLRVSPDTLKGNFTVNNPDFNYSGRSLITNLESTSTDKLTDSGYESSKTGFSLGTRFEKNENLFFSPTLSTFHESIDTNSTASASLKKQDGSYFENKFSYTFDYDLRDKKYQTTEGLRSVFNQSIPLISDDYALSNSYEITKWHQFDNKMIADINFYGKTVQSIKDEDVRISSRLGLPNNRLRGFESGKLGPVDGKDYIGGNYAVALNISTTLPMLFQSLENIDLQYFIDAGNVWGVDYSDTIDDSNTIRSSTGLAINWFTPIGPMNFAFTQNLSKASTDKVENFQFNIGTSF
ncbi:outer membrane protein assembly factor BamA [Candidatus Pelagibacter sp. Uisw_116]|uniref:outer membrane protein assembly factor BamA n=1 Tax=Candidatus Pelagibacter sp. Uisw_116 TaxID=3230986 RepID=UPI0039EB6E77